MPKRLDLTNKRFGRLVAQRIVGKRYTCYVWRCICDCGNTHDVMTGQLTSGQTRSCGCLRKENGLRQGAIIGYRTMPRVCKYCNETFIGHSSAKVCTKPKCQEQKVKDKREYNRKYGAEYRKKHYTGRGTKKSTSDNVCKFCGKAPTPNIRVCPSCVKRHFGSEMTTHKLR